jgi:nucleotide-binding universal stress UspA family protein
MKYLIATDGSPNASACIQYLSINRLTDRDSIKVISVWGASAYAIIPARLDKAQAETLIADAVNTLRVFFGERVSGECVRGDVATSILRVEQNWQADKVLIGAHARTELPAILVGDIAEEVLRRSKKSVLVFRNATGKNIKNHKKILCCVDSALLAEDVFAVLPDAVELRIFHVLQPEISYEKRGLALQKGTGSQRESLTPATIMQKIMDEQINKVARVRPDIITSTMTVEGDDPVAGILRYSSDWQADLIIMESHVHSFGERVFVGSVSEEVARRAECSVEVVR